MWYRKWYHLHMTTETVLPVSQARARLHPLVDAVAESGPIHNVGRRHSAVLVSEAEWNAITETLHIASQPALMAKIRASAAEPRAAMKTLDAIE